MTGTLKKIVLLLLIVTFGAQIQAQHNDYEERHWLISWLFGDDEKKYSSSGIYQDLDQRVDLNGWWLFRILDNPNWANLSYDDRDWEKIRVPSDWEDKGFNGYDGHAWYRTHFDGRELSKDEENFAILGFIDDVDETYINGHLIGKSGRFPPKFKTAYNSVRKYHIPNDLINFEGDNVIAVRVYDKMLNGGIVSGDLGIFSSMRIKELIQPLYGQWKFTKKNHHTYKQQDLDDADWDELVVPAMWDNQGYRSFDGVAWYRKDFKLSFNPEDDKTYYLTLGKIDDFDVTYLNGIKIGSNDDGLSYGRSTSYNQIRAYKIPSKILLENDTNVISIRVTDIGNHGGIYEGPIGIVEESKLTKVIRGN